MMKLFLFITTILLTASVQAQEAQPIIEACVKNAKKTLLTPAKLRKVCECSVTKTVEFVKSPNFESKDPAPRLEWLKKMYDLKLTQAEIDEDKHGIFEYNVSVTDQCIAEK